MKIKVTRRTMKRYKEIVEDLGTRAIFTEVPATCDGVKFRGVFTDSSKTEVIVSWPVDRPKEAQEQFAKDVCLGGEPVKEFEKENDWKHLTLAEFKQ